MKSSIASIVLVAAAFVTAAPARLTWGAQETAAVEATHPAASEGAWFRPDPFPHLGDDEGKGGDWMFMRIAGDLPAMSPLKTSDHQHLRVEGIYRVTEEEARLAGKEVEWSALRKEVEALLSRDQVARVEQLVIQRLGYRASSDPHIAQRLQLTGEQQKQISSRVEQYRFLVRDNQAELGRAWHRAAKLLDGEEPASRIKDLTAQKFARDQVFLLQLWSGIHSVLSERQRQEFNLMRGPMPESLRAILPRLHGNPGFVREGKTICCRRRDSLPPTAKAVDINPPSDQDAQLAWWKLMHNNGHDVDPDEVRQLRIIKEKLVDFIDPPRVFPKVGRARLHHAHYKCTVWSGEDEAGRRQTVAASVSSC